jgi:lipopolysaccharide biosynthesis protein
MANHTGSEGTVKVGANAIAEIRSYSVEQTGDTVEDTTMGDAWRTHKTTLKSWTGSVDVYWDEADTTGQGALTIGSSVTMNFYPEGATAGTSETYLTGTAIVTGVTVTASFDGMVESTLTVQGVGALTSATLA